MWAKLDGNGAVIGVSYTLPPTSEAGEVEPGWEEREDTDAGVIGYLQSDPLAEIQASAPDMLNFRMAMLSDPGYLRVTGLSAGTLPGMLNVTRLESALTFDVPYWVVVQAFWWQIVASLPEASRPTAAEIANWNDICNQWRVPIGFSSDGFLTLREPS